MKILASLIILVHILYTCGHKEPGSASLKNPQWSFQRTSSSVNIPLTNTKEKRDFYSSQIWLIVTTMRLYNVSASKNTYSLPRHKNKNLSVHLK